MPDPGAMPTHSLPPIASPSYLIGHRYQLLKKLGEGGMGVVYRAEDRLTGDLVALKRVRPPARDSLYSQTEQREALAHEFQTLAALHHPRIISVLDFGFDTDGRPFFTMDLLHEPVSIRTAAKTLSVEGRVRLLIETLQALVYLHRHGIVHRDLKPSNILIDRRGELRVLDFGLAEDAATARSSVGTLAYMAPETILEEGTTEQSDLYALGVIAYELFADRHPFSASSISQHIFATLEQEPDPTPLAIPEPLRAVVLRLLQKAPEARYASASDAIDALRAAAGLPPAEEVALQESALRSARFVGREAELQQLTQALEETFRGYGSAWLVGGEAGVGKTRLLAELRMRAQVRGAIVIDGQPHDPRNPGHQLWGAVLRCLLLIVRVSDAQAGALRAFVPDIERLVRRAVPDQPILTGEDAQHSLVTILIDMLRRLAQPVVLLLDDLHRSGGNLTTLRALCRAASDLPILILGAYRSDDARYFYGNLPQVNLIKLERLSAEAVQKLTVSILGAQAAHTGVAQYLYNQTEGNAFFVIETLRSLAAITGKLEDVGELTLPRQILSQGMLDIASRYLERLSPEYQELVHLAAIAGRYLDLDLLQRVAENVNLDDWLMKCADAAIIRFGQGRWRFSHDKIREGVLHRLPPERQRALHRSVAEALEGLYPDDAEYTPALAMHWHSAGDDIVRGLPYLLRYAARAIQLGEFRDVQPYLVSALESVGNEAQYAAARMNLHYLLGEVNEHTSNYPDAEGHYRSSLAHAVHLAEVESQAKALLGLGRILRYQSSFAEADGHLQQALNLFRQAGLPVGIGRALSELGRVAHMQMALDKAQMLFAEAAEIARAASSQPDLAYASYNLSLTTMEHKSYATSEAYAKEALAIYQSLGHQQGIADCLTQLARLRGYSGAYDQAIAFAEQSLAIYDRIGDRRQAMVVLGNIGFYLAQQHRYVESRTHFERSITVARELNIRGTVANRLGAVAQVHVHLGDWRAARRALHEWLALANEIGNVRALLHGFYGLVDLAIHDGDYARAAEWLGVIEQYAFPHHRDEAELKLRRDKLDTLLGADTESLIARGRALPLQDVVDAILADAESIFGEPEDSRPASIPDRA
mgnify:CR=1 FL=1